MSVWSSSHFSDILAPPTTPFSDNEVKGISPTYMFFSILRPNYYSQFSDISTLSPSPRTACFRPWSFCPFLRHNLCSLPTMRSLPAIGSPGNCFLRHFMYILSITISRGVPEVRHPALKVCFLFFKYLSGGLMVCPFSLVVCMLEFENLRMPVDIIQWILRGVFGLRSACSI